MYARIYMSVSVCALMSARTHGWHHGTAVICIIAHQKRISRDEIALGLCNFIASPIIQKLSRDLTCMSAPETTKYRQFP